MSASDTNYWEFSIKVINMLYPRGSDSQNNFGSVNIKSLYGNGVSFKVQLFSLKNPRKICILRDSKGNN